MLNSHDEINFNGEVDLVTPGLALDFFDRAGEFACVCGGGG